MGFGMVRFSSVSLKTVSRIVLVVAVTGSVVGCGSDAMRVDEASLANPFSGSARFGRSGQPVQTSQSSYAPMGGSVGSVPSGGVQSAPLSPPSGSSVVAQSAPVKAMAPALPKTETKLVAPNTITIAKGDTIKTVANRYGLSEQVILAANNNKIKLKPGTVLTLASTAAAPQKPFSVAESAPASSAKPAVQPPQTKQAVAAVAPEPAVDPKAKAKADKAAADKKTPDAKTVAEVKPAVEPKPAKGAKQTVAQAPVETTASVAPHVEPSAPTPVEFRWPARGHILKSFGEKAGEKSDGINIALPEGTPIKAAENGVVAYAGNELKGYGNLVLVRHDNGFVSAYANNSELKVKKGETVKRGQVIAASGQTGNVSSPQLHFELRKGSTPVDPMGFLSGN
jgi:murein DD-endopeptidase MepM/ murein hydrolase activator NlpD